MGVRENSRLIQKHGRLCSGTARRFVDARSQALARTRPPFIPFGVYSMGTIGRAIPLKRVSFAPREDIMRDFANVAANLELSRNVEELVYNGSLFRPKLDTFLSYLPVYRSVIEKREVNGLLEDDWYSKGSGPNPHHNYLEHQAANSLVNYARLLNEQQAILD